MSEVGLNVFAKNMGGLWYDWDKKEYRPKIEWYKDKIIEFVKQKDKPVAELINNEVI